MTYRSRGRSMVEVMIAAIFVGFLTGFVAVLCIGNYFRAKRAMERQKQRRIARLARGGGNGGIIDSPGSSNTSAGSHHSISDEQQHLLSSRNKVQSRARRNNANFEEVEQGTESLLLQVDDHDHNSRPIVDLMSV